VLATNFTVDATIESFNETAFVSHLHVLFPAVPDDGISILVTSASILVAIQFRLPSSSLPDVEFLMDTLGDSTSISTLSTALGVTVLHVTAPTLTTEVVHPPYFATLLPKLTMEQARTVGVALSTVSLVAMGGAVTVGGFATALPLAFAMQRAVLISSLSGSAVHPIAASLAVELRWVLGRTAMEDDQIWIDRIKALLAQVNMTFEGVNQSTDILGGPASTDGEAVAKAVHFVIVCFNFACCLAGTTLLHLVLLSGWRIHLVRFDKRRRAAAAAARRRKEAMSFARLTRAASAMSGSVASRGDRVGPHKSAMLPTPPPSPPSLSDLRDNIFCSETSCVAAWLQESSTRASHCTSAVADGLRTKQKIRDIVTSPLPPLPENFTPLPNFLIWPNPQVAVLIVFAAGVVQNSISTMCLVKHAPSILLTASFGILFFVAFLLVEFTRILRFSRRHSSRLWNESVNSFDDRLSAHDVGDPLLRIITRAGIVRPAPRFRGSFEPKSVDIREPGRTRRNVHIFGAGRYPGDSYASLSSTWVADVGARSGIYYQLVKVLIQVLFAMVAGVTRRYTVPLPDAQLQMAVLAILQISLGVYCTWSGSAGDRLEGVSSGIEGALSGIAVAVQSTATKQEDGSMLTSAAVILCTAMCLPLAMILYDLVVLPCMFIGIGRRLIDRSQVRFVLPSSTQDLMAEAIDVSKPHVEVEKDVATGVRGLLDAWRARAREREEAKELLRTNACITIQSAFRCQVAKRETTNLRERHELERAQREEQEADFQAAAILQALWRGHHARNPEMFARKLAEMKLISFQRAWRDRLRRDAGSVSLAAPSWRAPPVAPDEVPAQPAPQPRPAQAPAVQETEASAGPTTAPVKTKHHGLAQVLAATTEQMLLSRRAIIRWTPSLVEPEETPRGHFSHEDIFFPTLVEETGIEMTGAALEPESLSEVGDRNPDQ
jgi:hypothetical protein